MEQQADLQSAAPIARGHNAVHLVPADWASVPGPLTAALERIDASSGGVQLLVLVSDAEAAMAVVSALSTASGGGVPRAIAATGAARAARVLRAGAAPVVVGAPSEILALLRGAALKLDGLRGLAIAWLEQIIDAGGSADLEAVMAAVPKEVPRTIITATLRPAVEDFIERYARRAARIGGLPHPPLASTEPPAGSAASDRLGATSAATARSAGPMAYVLGTAAARPAALRRLLDEIDPPSALVYIRSDDSERAVRDTLVPLGYAGNDSPVRTIRAPTAEHAALLVLYDLPLDVRELHGAGLGSPARTIALLLPRQLAHLRGLTGGAVAPYVSDAPADAARAQQEAIRGELRRELVAGPPAREVLALEPLLAEFDGVALAAAALRLLERTRADHAAAAHGERSRADGDQTQTRDRTGAARRDDATSPGAHRRPFDRVEGGSARGDFRRGGRHHEPDDQARGRSRHETSPRGRSHDRDRPSGTRDVRRPSAPSDSRAGGPPLGRRPGTAPERGSSRDAAQAPDRSEGPPSARPGGAGE